MSHNIPKKLSIKAELLRYLTIAEEQLNAGAPSSVAKVVTVRLDLLILDHGKEPDLAMWEKCLGRNQPK